jgi:protein-S-isoprenylcysteine O-methyltransferase Ste14
VARRVGQEGDRVERGGANRYAMMDAIFAIDRGHRSGSSAADSHCHTMFLDIFTCIMNAVKLWLLLTAIFLGCIFIGWGRDSWNGYWIFTMGCWASLDVCWALAARRSTPIVAGGRSGSAPLAVVLIYAIYCLPLGSVPLLGQRVMPRFSALELFGALMCAFGVMFSIWARHILSENWNAAATAREGLTLVQHGPYAIVRHPIYLGFLAAVVGMILALGEVRALVLLMGVELLLKKMGQEESVLQATFPTEYPQYERRVKRLLPWIW